jgi:cellulose synthase/poly-beta-1,6-N-acetylglucosamine synthase-like glycosyltransferase
MVSLLPDVAFVIAVTLCAGIAVLHVPDLYLIVVHLSRGAREIAKERAMLGARTPAKDPAASVCVQLTVFNEPQSVAAAIDSICALEWPRDRLEIMILDDSTDETRDIAASRVATWRSRGIDVRHCWRAHRRDYKAGALADALGQTSSDYIAIFDVDYRPGRDFLAKTMRSLTAAPEAAFVQARLDYRNRDRNALTRAQAIQLDSYFAYEQAGRVWAGIPTPFNGTGAVWRRTQSLLEDMDISLRAFAKGWIGVHLMTVPVAGELPDTLGALVSQRRRWATGTGQSFRALPWTLLQHLRLDRAIVFSLISLEHAGVTILLPVAAAAVLAWALIEPAQSALAFALLAMTLALVVALKSAGAALANRTLGRGFGWAFLVDLLAMWILEARLLPSRAGAQLQGLLRRQRVPFMRTPKKGEDGTRPHGPG